MKEALTNEHDISTSDEHFFSNFGKNQLKPKSVYKTYTYLVLVKIAYPILSKGKL
jgi:hypothetical protein